MPFLPESQANFASFDRFCWQIVYSSDKLLGADKVIDYTQEDFTQSGETYDVIFDAVGKISSSRSKSSLKKKGIYLTVKSPTSEKTEYLILLKELIDAGKIKAVIDGCYPLEQIAE
ncbi:MAG: zinc-binding dehydrogenase, partial [Chlorobium sp.]